MSDPIRPNDDAQGRHAQSEKGPEEQPETKQADLAAFWKELRRRHVVRVAITYAVVAWLIIQIAASTFEGFGIPEWAFRFVVIMVILGFPIAVLLAWAFELTPEGIKTTKTAKVQHPDSHKDKSHVKKRHWFSLGMAAAIPTVIFGALAAYFYATRSDSSPSVSPDVSVGGSSPGLSSSNGHQVEDLDKSIAILPFANRSNREEDQFFTDGIHDDLLTQISRIRSIRTLARTSVLSYRDTTKRMKDIGDELGVQWLLEGGVQRGGDEIRINAQLIEVASEGHVWAETYTRDLTAENIFQIQDEITNAIAKALRVVLSLEEQERIKKLPTGNIAALEAFFKGRDLLDRGHNESRIEALLHLEEAISMDPNFALAHAYLAWGMIRGPFGASNLDQAAIHVSRALALDDSLSDAYSALGLLEARRGDREAAIKAYKKALELDPRNATGYHAYARILFRRIKGLTMEVSGLFRKAYELDPKDQLALSRLAFSFEASGQWDEALETRKRDVAENPGRLAALRELGRVYQDLGHLDEAIVSIRKYLADYPEDPVRLTNLSVAYSSLGDVEQAISLGNRHLEAFEIPGLQEDVDVETLIHSLSGDEALLEQRTLEGLKNNPSSTAFLAPLTELYLRSGRVDELKHFWTQGFPALFGSPPELDAVNAQGVKHVARILLATGEPEQANRLIEHALAFLGTQAPNRHSHLEEAVLHAVAGDDRKAMDSIRRCLDAGGSPYELMRLEPLKPFENNPEYQAMAEKRKAELAVQLERIRRMEANGELAPLPF